MPTLKRQRNYLDRLRVAHLDLYRTIAEVAEGELFMPDLILLPMLQRSYGLVEGFLDSFDAHNLAAAAPLVRLQLDSLFRAHFIATAPSSDEICQQLWKGQEFRHIRDGDGKKLTDARLKDLASTDHPWARDVYDHTSGWVHFSPSHVKSSWQVEVEGDGHTIAGGIPYRPGSIPVERWQELLGAMTQATVELFEYLWGWSQRKGLPPRASREVERPWPDDDER